MPIYEYKCTKGHVFEVMQRMSDDSLTKCEVCGAPVQRVFHPIAVHFKGSGFYNTDYGTKRRSREAKEAAAADGKSSSDTGAGSGSSSSESAGAKPEKSTKTESTKAPASSSSPSSD
jgi:putative FmdB family regulatory protein